MRLPPFVAAVAALSVGLSLGACAVREARMALPPALQAETSTVELRGMGGATGGEFRLGEARGRFTRSAERLAVADPLYVRRGGTGTFRLEASAETGGAALEGRCRHEEHALSAGVAAVTPGRLRLHCDFARDGRPVAAALTLNDPKGMLGALHGRAERRGELTYEGLRLEVASVHHDRGGGLASPLALGYLFSVDGRAVGAVDLNGLDKTLHLPRDPALREAVLAAALALSVFWDPEGV